MHATYYEALDTAALPQGVLTAIFLSMEQHLADLLELKISSEAVGCKGSCCAFAVGSRCISLYRMQQGKHADLCATFRTGVQRVECWTRGRGSLGGGRPPRQSPCRQSRLPASRGGRGGQWGVQSAA